MLEEEVEVVIEEEVEEKGIQPLPSTDRVSEVEAEEDVMQTWYDFRVESFLTTFPNPKSDKEVTMEIKNISMEGYIFIEFNQDLLVPPFTPWKNE